MIAMYNDYMHEKTRQTELPNRLNIFWHWLVEPGPSFVDDDERRRAKLLSSIVILMFPLIILLGIVLMPLVIGAPSLWQSPTFLPATSALIVSMISYLLNRLGYFRAAAAIYIFIFIAAPMLAVTSNSSQINIAIGTLMLGGVFIASALFSNNLVSILAVIGVAGATLLIPLFSSEASLKDISALLGANITNGVLVLLYSYYRNGLEIHRHAQLNKLNVQLQESYSATLEGWAQALELMDKETEGHSRRVMELSMDLARELGLHEDEIRYIRYGSLLHDIGKMGIPNEILNKPGPFTPEERAIVEQHPIYAFGLLKDIRYLQKAISIPYSHHENWDGTGYPQGLQGEEIPLSARIFAVVDNWDALTSDRPYRKAWPREKVITYG